MADCTAWRNFAPCCLSDAMWDVAAKTPDAVLSHRSCPWGGHMIKIDSKNLFVQDAPEDPRDVLVRPEVRAMCHSPDVDFQGIETFEDVQLRCLETYAPGYALVEETNANRAIQLAGVLFGRGFDPLRTYHRLPAQGACQLCKDWPEEGNCTYIAFEGMWIMCRHSECYSRYRSILVFSTPVDSFPPSILPFLPAITDMFHDLLKTSVNGQTIRGMRGIDAEMYLVLTLRSYSRGNPLVPQRERSQPCSEETFTVSRGKQLGLVSWKRFKPYEKFYLSEYLQYFMQELGHELKTYNTLDGRRLVAYQCVVVRREWDQLRTAFLEFFKVHRAVYRRANGGTGAPSLSEDGLPHFVPHGDSNPETLCESTCSQPAIKTVVRNTFLELDEDSNDSLHLGLKRSNSTSEIMTVLV